MTIYFDGVHLASPNLEELHAFAEKVGLKRCWFEGARKSHPHYDITNSLMVAKVLANGAKIVTPRELIRECYREGK